jgi:small subunit ribosomal protein S1
MAKNNIVIPMDQLLDESPNLEVPEAGTIITGKVITVDKKCIMVDINGILTGIVAGREIKDALETAKELKPGAEISACVLESENEEGLVVLSLRRASQEKTWTKFQKAYEENTSFKVKANEANKGGLLLEIDGIKGFIPVSQLAPLHYPRVNGADSAKILSRLQKLTGIELTVKIISIDKENGKLILSEKEAFATERNSALGNLNSGDVVEGTISGIVKFGIFVAFEGLEGLVHISEIAWGHVKDAHDYGKLGDKVKVKIIGIEGDKISLSMKQLTSDPWAEITSKYKIGDKIKGKITRLAQFGAFVELTDEINGLIHSSEIPGDPADPADVLKVGQDVEARVIELNLDEKRVGLSLKEEGEAPAAKKEAASEEAVEEKPKKKKAKKEDQEEAAE